MTKLHTILGLSLCMTGCLVGDESEGENDEEIIGGTIDYGDPSVVAIGVYTPGSTTARMHCTGAVISPTAILTAAHCVDPRVVGSGNSYEVRAGTFFSAGQPLAVAGSVMHTGFDPSNLAAGNDIAIIKLAQPTSLPPLPYGSLSTSSVRHVGYGMNTHVNVPYVDGGAGIKRTVTTTLNGADGALLHSGNSNNQICHGDSGGPAFQQVGGQEVITGVHSFGENPSQNAVCFFGGYSTRVDAHLGFIEANKW